MDSTDQLVQPERSPPREFNGCSGRVLLTCKPLWCGSVNAAAVPRWHGRRSAATKRAAFCLGTWWKRPAGGILQIPQTHWPNAASVWCHL